MSRMTSVIASAATLALALVPAAALTTAAHAQTGRAVHIAIGDLDLASPAGARAFDARVAAAAQSFCRSDQPVTARESCRDAIREEAYDNLPARARAAVELARAAAPAPRPGI